MKVVYISALKSDMRKEYLLVKDKYSNQRQLVDEDEVAGKASGEKKKTLKKLLFATNSNQIMNPKKNCNHAYLPFCK